MKNEREEKRLTQRRGGTEGAKGRKKREEHHTEAQRHGGHKEEGRMKNER
jgi:hypothetical protein